MTIKQGNIYILFCSKYIKARHLGSLTCQVFLCLHNIIYIQFT